MKGYMCKTDFDYHLEEDYNGVEIYPSVESLKKHCKCVNAKKMTCGIVEVEIKLSKVMKEGSI